MKVHLVECAVDGRPPVVGRADGDGAHGAAVGRILDGAGLGWCWYGAVDGSGAYRPLAALDAVGRAVASDDAVLVELQAIGGWPLDVHAEIAGRFDALVARGVVVFLPAGNGGHLLPAPSSRARRVGALDPWGGVDERSCRGPGVTEWAAGTRVDGLSGTSRAAALALVAWSASAPSRQAQPRGAEEGS